MTIGKIEDVIDDVTDIARELLNNDDIGSRHAVSHLREAIWRLDTARRALTSLDPTDALSELSGGLGSSRGW